VITGGIMRRTLTASAVLALVVSAAFIVLWFSIKSMRDWATLSRHSQSVLSVANRFERLVIDLETGERGFLLTGQARFLQPWNAARRAEPGVSAQLQRLTRVSEQLRRSRAIDATVRSYIRDYSVPLVRAAQRDRAGIDEDAVAIEGKRRIDAIRARFDDLIRAEQELAADRQDRAVAAARRSAVAAGAGLAASLLFVAIFVGYVAGAILEPIRRAAGMANHLARGDLAVRTPESGPGEVGELERSFNAMARSLQASQAELRLLAEEQAALRRVATLVARRASPSAVFDAVAAEVRGLLPAPATRLLRLEPDGTATVVAARSDPDIEIPVGTNMALDGDNVGGMVTRSGRPARMDSLDHAGGPIATLARRLGIRSAVGVPISVEGRLWGVMVAAWTDEDPPADTETRMTQFTEVVATAIADAARRVELAASRARIVATADETRRRIERDLHDGAQQRLVSLGLTLRGAADAAAPHLKAQLLNAADDLGGVVDELRELSRGIHPAILSQGLKPALKNVVRRSKVPVEIQVRTDRRFPQPVEVTAYYVLVETLTNAAKHANASRVRVEVEAADATLELRIRDDGVGGADPCGGTGLMGLRDRVEALGGELAIDSPAGGGTSIRASIPLDEASPDSAAR
jgi:signal transduction histidine kinase